MSTPKFGVIVQADISNLKKGLKEAEVSLENLTDAQKEAAAYAKQLATEKAKVDKAFSRSQKSAGAATVTFMELNRVIQDFPFGINGVGNNLQQLSANFGLLVSRAKGVGPALKQTFSTAMSGINPYIIAVSAITTLWTMYSQGVFDAKEETKDFKDELDKFIKTLGDVNAAQLDGASKAEKESRTFEELRIQAENANIPLNDRLEAVKALQEKYPDYLGKLSSEQILTGNVGTAYEELTKNIIANAKARAFSDKIAENSIKILQIEERTLDRANKITEARNKLERLKSTFNKGPQSGPEQQAIGFQIAEQQNKINALVTEQIADAEEVAKINGTNAELTERIASAVKDGARFTEDTKNKVKEATDAFKAFSKAQDEVNRIFFLEGREAYEKFKQELEEANTLQDRLVAKSKELIQGFTSFDDLSNKIMRDLGGPPTKETADVYNPTEDLKEVAKQAALTEAAFDGLARATSRALGNGNEWGRFASDFLKFAGEIIATNFAIAKSNVITGATAAGAAAGPLAPFATPALITQGLALIGSLFAAIMGGSKSAGGGGGTSKSYGKPPGRRFGGNISAGIDYIVGEDKPEVFRSSFSGKIYPSIEDYASSMAGVGSKSQSKIKVQVEVYGTIEGETIRVTNRRSERRINKT